MPAWSSHAGTCTSMDSAVAAEGPPVQWSRNYFLPGKLSLRLVRDTPAHRDPAIVLQLLADT